VFKDRDRIPYGQRWLPLRAPEGGKVLPNVTRGQGVRPLLPASDPADDGAEIRA
jgi:hypothetical protein